MPPPLLLVRISCVCFDTSAVCSACIRSVSAYALLVLVPLSLCSVAACVYALLSVYHRVLFCRKCCVATTQGVCFDVQLVEGGVPREDHDILMDLIVSESGVQFRAPDVPLEE